MGRGRLPATQRRIKFHLANVMVETWVYDTISAEATRTKTTIKEQAEKALTTFASQALKRLDKDKRRV